MKSKVTLILIIMYFNKVSVPGFTYLLAGLISCVAKKISLFSVSKIDYFFSNAHLLLISFLLFFILVSVKKITIKKAFLTNLRYLLFY